MSEDQVKTSNSIDDLIPQDHHRGPGWFLKLSYVIIVIFCLYYLFTYWDWKSDYQLQQEEIQSSITQTDG
jgi:hypothetical protein